MDKMITISNREVTRKEFLQIAGAGLLSIMGLGSIIKLLTGKHPLTNQVSRGYGSNSYGR